MEDRIKPFLLAAIFLVTNMIPVIAQEEAQQYFTVDEMPDLIQILPPPPDSSSVTFARDVTQYMWGKAQCLDPVRSEIAINDAEYSLDNIIRIFSNHLECLYRSKALQKYTDYSGISQ